MKLPLLFLFSLFCISVSAQDFPQKTCRGKIIAGISSLEGINVINLRTEKYAVTDKEGYFSIQAAVCDTLMFSGVQFNPVKIELSQEQANDELLYVKMEPLVTELREVVLRQYKNINAVALGIIPAGQKQYTPAERRLKTASGGILTVDPLLNLFSGRTAMLKRDVETEKKAFWLERILELYQENILVSQFKIPLDYVRGFLYFVVEDKRFVESLASKDKTMATFLLTGLAEKYKSLKGL